MEHYIIIRVKEEATTGRTHSGILRNMIHRFAMENDITIADNLVRADRSLYPDGRVVPYKEAKELFGKATGMGYKELPTNPNPLTIRGKVVAIWRNNKYNCVFCDASPVSKDIAYYHGEAHLDV